MNIDLDRDDANMVSQDMQINKSLSIEAKTRVRNLFEQYYVNAERPLIPATENTMKLVLTDNKLFSYTPRRLSYDEKNRLRSILDGLIAKGIIRESASEHASPIVLTKKKNGKTRMCRF